VFDCFDREVRVNSRSISAILAAVFLLEAESLGYPCGLPKQVPLQPSLSPVFLTEDRRMAVGLEPVGNVGAAAGHSVQNESLVTAELLHIESVHSSQLNIAPPQFFTRVLLRLLTVGDTPGTPSFLTGRDRTVLNAYTREQVNADLVGKKIECKLRYRGDERGGLYWMYEIRALPGNS
jgi:hypothetical protein